MQNLPTATVYEKEFTYMPWGILIKEILSYISQKAPEHGTVLDLLCGPGYLLGKLNNERPDLNLHGVDLESEFIAHAKNSYPALSFEQADAFTWNSNKKYDVLLVTAGLHHLPYEQQESLVQKISTLLAPNGFAIVADPYIDDYTNEQERKLAAAKLGYEYLITTINNGGTDDVVDAALQVLVNDIDLVEWKSSIKKNTPIFEKYFTHVAMHKTWPTIESDYGDYYFILKNE